MTESKPHKPTKVKGQSGEWRDASGKYIPVAIFYEIRVLGKSIVKLQRIEQSWKEPSVVSSEVGKFRCS